MKIRLLNFENVKAAEHELKKINCHYQGINLMTPKSVFRVVKLYDIKTSHGNIIKQTMLSVGGEAAISKNTVECSLPTTDIVLFGTVKHFKKFSESMELQQPTLQKIGKEIWRVVSNSSKPVHKIWQCRSKTFDLSKKTLIMAIVNLTPDSFSDGGQFEDTDAVLYYVEQAIKDGADIIDIGGESSRPGAQPLGADEELNRILPAIEKIKERFDIPISVDTYKSIVAEECLRRNVEIINDITALRSSPDMTGVINQYGAGIILMHMKGTPQNMQVSPEYDDVIAEVGEFLDERIKFCEEAGIKLEQIVIDPGIGFGKTMNHNLQIIHELKAFLGFHRPVLIGVSRKLFIGKILNLPVNERDEGTAAAVAAAVLNGARIVRVHNVQLVSRTVKIIDAIINSNFE